MDTNTAINNIKKITRRVESGEFDRYYVSTSLSNIRHMLYSLGLCNEASSVQEVCYELAGSKYSVKSINSRLSHIMAILRKIKGKTVAKECGRETFRKKAMTKAASIRITFQPKDYHYMMLCWHRFMVVIITASSPESSIMTALSVIR